MGPELLEIQPEELNFTFEVKKKSSCSVQLVNKSHEYVAFKEKLFDNLILGADSGFRIGQIKTTSPKRYSVQPNTGVILPRSKCAFTVTMQAQRSAPPDMQLKDKFLVQSTVVPYGSADEDILPSFFSKDSGRYIEENKLRVVLVSPSSPVLQPTNGALKHEQANEAPFSKETAAPKEFPGFEEAPVLKETPALKETPDLKQTPVSKDQVPYEVENLALSKVLKDVEDLKLKINNLETKLNEASKVIATLREEKSLSGQEKDKLRQEIVLLRRKSAAMVHGGFPFLFVVFMALVGVAIGYLLSQ